MISNTSCLIPSNPDVVGIGVRTAIYAQNLLSFVPAFFAIHDGKVTPAELQSIENQSMNILVTALAILITTIIQGQTTLTNYHAAIVLNLSWMNNTNLFIYFLLYCYHRSSLAAEAEHRKRQQPGKTEEGLDSNGTKNKPTRKRSQIFMTIAQSLLGGIFFLSRKEQPKEQETRRWVVEAKEFLSDPVFWVGSSHLSMMSAVGIWLWRSPARFGSSESMECILTTPLTIIGGQATLGSTSLRSWSLFIYSLFLLPIANLTIPILFFAGIAGLLFRFRSLWERTKGSTRSAINIPTVSVGLLLLTATVVILLVNTEVTIARNKRSLTDNGDTIWTFGQILALLLLLLPLRDLTEILYERNPKVLGKKLMKALYDDKIDIVEDAIRAGANASYIGA